MLPTTIKFSKLNSAGNDFICLDNTLGDYAALFDGPSTTAIFARLLCRRGLSVGADGLIVANQVDDGDSSTIIARFLEPDGSESRLCGNGTACFTYWAIAQKLVTGPEVQVITQAGTARGRLLPELGPTEVRVCIPDPSSLQHKIEIELENQSWTVSVIDIGVPHAIIYVEDIARINVDYWGRLIRHHPRFQPAGINVNFVQILEPGHLAIRTFEFGVESETLACGTGSAAAAIMACLEKKWGTHNHDCDRSINISTHGGDILRVWFKLDQSGEVNNVCLETKVRPIYEAIINHELHRELYQALRGAGSSGPKS